MIDPVQLRDALHERGYVHCPAPGLLAQAERDPWAVAERLHDRVVLVEAHPIKPLPDGRSYASTKIATPLHTDSQSHRGVPAHLQVMLCERPATQGGETLLLDTWALLERIAAAEPDLLDALLTRPRRLPFVFGDVVGPTLALRGASLVFSHPPVPVDDAIGRRLAAWIDRAPRIELSVRADELLLVDNHRMLHGRRAFQDERRRFIRLLVWTDSPTRAPAWLLDPARELHERIARSTRRLSPTLREPLIGPPAAAQDQRLALVLQMLRGASPGQLARQHGIPEPELYRWRDAVLRGANDALAQLDDPIGHRAALDRARQQLERKLR